MNKPTPKKPRQVRKSDADTIRPEYDFSKGVRGITAKRYADGSNVVLLDPDVQAAFPTSKAVNAALRSVMQERAGGVPRKRASRSR